MGQLRAVDAKNQDELLDAICENDGGYFDKADVMIVAELIKIGNIEMKDEDLDGKTLFATDLGRLRYYERMVRIYKDRVYQPEAASK